MCRGFFVGNKKPPADKEVETLPGVHSLGVMPELAGYSQVTAILLLGYLRTDYASDPILVVQVY
jgi:hypothetical protein